MCIKSEYHIERSSHYTHNKNYMSTDTSITTFESPAQLKQFIAGNCQKQIENFFGDPKQALKFLSSVIASAQRNPKLMQCTAPSVINSFMTMAQLGLMPSDVSGEAYVIPYNNKKKDEATGRWYTVMEAQFQLGYQGLVTLFYRAGAKKVVAEIVHKADKFRVVNGEVYHEPDFFAEDRGEAVGAYVIVELGTGGIISKVMKKSEIMDIGSRFSKTYSSESSPWNIKNDPQLWMWRKTVLKQIAKLIPKNETLLKAIAKDNEDSTIHHRAKLAIDESASLRMGNLLTHGEQKNEEQEKEKSTDPAPETPVEHSAPESHEEQESGIDEWLPDFALQPDVPMQVHHESDTIQNRANKRGPVRHRNER